MIIHNDLVFGQTDGFTVIDVEKENRKINSDVKSTQPGCNCPSCGEFSSCIHSYYIRTILDLPVLCNETWIRLKARKFYCRSCSCKIKVFTERFSHYFSTGRRMTENVRDKILKVALLMGGNGGGRICRLMNMPVSSSTLIRSLHRKPVPEVQATRVVGLDEWAYRKGVKYGTVLVNMERQKIIDLLPDREADTVEKWLKQHPQIEVVSRDRYTNYATGVSKVFTRCSAGCR